MRNNGLANGRNEFEGVGESDAGRLGKPPSDGVLSVLVDVECLADIMSTILGRSKEMDGLEYRGMLNIRDPHDLPYDNLKVRLAQLIWIAPFRIHFQSPLQLRTMRTKHIFSLMSSRCCKQSGLQFFGNPTRNPDLKFLIFGDGNQTPPMQDIEPVQSE